jgi:hypothetical protein
LSVLRLRDDVPLEPEALPVSAPLFELERSEDRRFRARASSSDPPLRLARRSLRLLFDASPDEPDERRPSPDRFLLDRLSLERLLPERLPPERLPPDRRSPELRDEREPLPRDPFPREPLPREPLPCEPLPRELLPREDRRDERDEPFDAPLRAAFSA